MSGPIGEGGEHPGGLRIRSRCGGVAVEVIHYKINRAQVVRHAEWGCPARHRTTPILRPVELVVHPIRAHAAFVSRYVMNAPKMRRIVHRDRKRQSISTGIASEIDRKLKAQCYWINRGVAPHAIVESAVGVWLLRGLSIRGKTY